MMENIERKGEVTERKSGNDRKKEKGNGARKKDLGNERFNGLVHLIGLLAVLLVFVPWNSIVISGQN